jgi:hypothetical protein
MVCNKRFNIALHQIRVPQIEFEQASQMVIIFDKTEITVQCEVSIAM